MPQYYFQTTDVTHFATELAARDAVIKRHGSRTSVTWSKESDSLESTSRLLQDMANRYNAVRPAVMSPLFTFPYGEEHTMDNRQQEYPFKITDLTPVAPAVEALGGEVFFEKDYAVIRLPEAIANTAEADALLEQLHKLYPRVEQGTRPRFRPGKLIAIDGIDGSGKQTQVERLVAALELKGYSVATMDFPQYENNIAGGILGKLLRDETYELSMGETPAEVAAIIYAMDRRESLPRLRALQAENDFVILDRWVECNAVYQAVRHALANNDESEELFDMAMFRKVRRIEYGVMGLPSADVAIFLDVAPETTRRLLEADGKELDVNESDFKLQRALYEGFRQVVGRRSGLYSVDCLGRPDERAAWELLRPGQITEKILDVLDQTVFAQKPSEVSFTGMATGDGECFTWVIPRTEYEAMGLEVHTYDSGEQEGLADEMWTAPGIRENVADEIWTDPAIHEIDGVEHVAFSPTALLDALGIEPQMTEKPKFRKYRVIVEG